MKEAQKRIEAQLSHLTELLQGIANQSTVNPQAQAQPSSPLSSQPLPNPKGGINAVQVEEEEDEIEDEDNENDWLYELLKKLANSDDDEEDKGSEDESEEEDGDESTEKGSEDKFVEEGDQTEEEAREEDKDKGNIFFINTLFKIQGISIPYCLCDLGACGNIMPFEVYELLDLGPLKKSKEVFTTANARDKGGKPQVLLGRPFLKTAGLKLIYYDEIFTFEVGNVIEIFHLPPPPKPRKKGLHQLQQDRGKKIKNKPWKEEKGRKRKEKKPMIKPNHFKEKRKKRKPKDNTGSDQKNKRKKRGRSSTEEKRD
ncbi:hypothetical protein PIB30_098968 [Stylosanthes scabra]|uniref:Uncharacterized protein n=1 Tax=Stylosanthes scabra TaxID=79078 RepID=A0ABU6YUZ2_9FABA|nr:hypothetical protein [Stylosanthes scabra]